MLFRKLFCLVAFAAILCTSSTGLAGLTSLLDSAEDFAVLAGSTVTNTGNTTINGDIGVWPGTSYTGSGTVTQTGDVYLGGAATGVAGTAQGDLTTAYNALAGMPVNTTLTGTNLGGLTLAPGVYKYDSGALLTGTLSLDAQGFNNVSWVFQIGTALTTETDSAVQFVDLGTNGGADNGVFWQVGSSATLGTRTAFAGNILADQSISFDDGASLYGGALARIGGVTLIGNTINTGLNGGLAFDDSGNVVPVPVPGALLLACSGMGSVLAFGRRFFSKS